ncbi:MAG: tetratricopeptide repeat protein [Sulfuritalea sp.]|nr:tetratricopeptide repeat protein [Sulfuritalea sp.]
MKSSPSMHPDHNQPQTAEACVRTGVEHMENGRLEAAQASYRRAMELDPDCAEAHFKLGNVYLKRQRPEPAEACFRRAIEIAPNYVKALYNLGNLLLRQSRLDEAAVCYKRALSADPDYTYAHINLGVALKDQGHYAEAETSYLAALKLDPDNTEILNNLSVVQIELGRLAEAEANCSRALELLPGFALAHNCRGAILNKQGRLAEAESCYRKALALSPGYAEALNNLGIVLKTQGRLEEVEDTYRRAINARPGYVNAYKNLGAFLTDQGRFAEAEAIHRRLLEFDAMNPQTHNHLGCSLVNQGRSGEAIASFRSAMEFKPDYLSAHSNLLFALNYGSDNSGSSMLEEANRYGRTVTELAKAPFSAWKCTAPPERLRVGLVSGDFRMHPVGYFLDNVLAHIKKSRVDLIAYPTGGLEDAMTASMRKHFLEWKPIVDLDNEAAAHLIHADGIHILIDLSGHTTDNRLPVFGWKPAPVQASWLGYFATTGVTQIDYLLATRIEVPDSNHHQFTESICYLPETRLCFTAPKSEIPVSGLPALGGGGVTFGCFQKMSKVGDQVLDIWARILSALPDARLRIQCSDPGDVARKHLSKRLQRFGIDSERVTIHAVVSRESYLAAHAEVDIILDTFPYPGGTTTCEALWMGVPTLTLAGNTMVERQGASFLTVAGLPDWIASNKTEYVDKAIAAAQSLQKLADLRSRLRQQVLRSPLFDAPRFASQLEDALWQIWQEKGLHQPGGSGV